jgi:hypothetical protein
MRLLTPVFVVAAGSTTLFLLVTGATFQQAPLLHALLCFTAPLAVLGCLTYGIQKPKNTAGTGDSGQCGCGDKTCAGGEDG